MHGLESRMQLALASAVVRAKAARASSGGNCYAEYAVVHASVQGPPWHEAMHEMRYAHGRQRVGPSTCAGMRFLLRGVSFLEACRETRFSITKESDGPMRASQRMAYSQGKCAFVVHVAEGMLAMIIGPAQSCTGQIGVGDQGSIET